MNEVRQNAAAGPEKACFLAARRIWKRYGAIEALRDVSFDIVAGEVHALVGENGAGKSTLMKVLAGEERPDTGHIEIDGARVQIDSPFAAQSLGISIVHQQFQLVDTLSVAENLYLGDRTVTVPFGPVRLVQRRRMVELAAEQLRLFDLQHRAARLVRELPIAERQIVEIAKALRRRARLLILDEPTSSLNATEAERLTRHVRLLRSQGTAIVYIAHSIEEVLSIADRVTVLRDGRSIATEAAADFDVASLVRMIVGRELEKGYPKAATVPGAPMLRAEAMQVAGSRKGWSVELRRGEVYGIPTYVGSSIDSLLGGLSGQLAVRGGRLTLDEQDVGRSNIRGRIKHGICFVPGDANVSGLIPRMSIEENILLPNLQRFQTWGVVNKRAARAAVERMIDMLNIRPAKPDFPVDKLSGGNRQKVVIAKWLAAGAQVLVMDDPTKGVDVGAKVEIYTVMANLAEKRTSIVLASSDLDELLGVADRIAVIRDGEIVQLFDSRPFDKKDVLARLTGAALPAEAVSR